MSAMSKPRSTVAPKINEPNSRVRSESTLSMETGNKCGIS